MLENIDNNLKVDLRKRSSIRDVLNFDTYNFNSCMAILLVFSLLLLSIVAIVSAPNPIYGL